jgi:hypothetical protein
MLEITSFLMEASPVKLHIHTPPVLLKPQALVKPIIKLLPSRIPLSVHIIIPLLTALLL